jgi:hypothetical protein
MEMDDQTLKDLRKAVEELVYSSTKSTAKAPASHLEYLVSNVSGNLEPYFFEKLREVVIYAKEASGQVKNKEHWINNVNQSWYIFENGVRDDH